jgi:hypothetical protein
MKRFLQVKLIFGTVAFFSWYGYKINNILKKRIYPFFAHFKPLFARFERNFDPSESPIPSSPSLPPPRSESYAL